MNSISPKLLVGDRISSQFLRGNWWADRSPIRISREKFGDIWKEAKYWRTLTNSEANNIPQDGILLIIKYELMEVLLEFFWNGSSRFCYSKKEITTWEIEEDYFHFCEGLLEIFIMRQESLEKIYNEAKREFYLRRTIHPAQKAL